MYPVLHRDPVVDKRNAGFSGRKQPRRDVRHRILKFATAEADGRKVPEPPQTTYARHLPVANVVLTSKVPEGAAAILNAALCRQYQTLTFLRLPLTFLMTVFCS